MLKFTKYYIRPDKCRLCMTCFYVCPQKAIIQKSDETLEILQDKCDSCGACMKNCKLRVITKIWKPRIYHNN